MPDHSGLNFDSEEGTTPTLPGQLSANGQWVFGSLYAGLVVLGFGFGVWAGASRPKLVEVVEVKKEPEKPAPKPAVTPPAPVVTPPAPVVNPPVEPEPKEPEPKPKDPEPKPKEPEPKPKEPEPKPKEPKPDAKPVAFKEVLPILRSYCFDCHGAAGKAKGEVDVTSIAKMLKSKGPPLVPGKPEQSTLYLSVKAGDMPPDGKKGPSEKELKLIYDWIAGGAKERRRPVRNRGAARGGRRRVELTAVADAG
jgi:hypothetical protein